MSTQSWFDALLLSARKPDRLIIGLMSGTSADGIDAVVVRITGADTAAKLKLVYFACYPFPTEVRPSIFELFSEQQGTVDKLCTMNFVLGELFAEAAVRVARDSGVALADIDLIGSHGQTLYHQPRPVSVGPVTTRSTLQVGEPSVIAERTGRPVIADFHPRDVAAGGEGAPLMLPKLDYVLFRDEHRGRAILNLGGISNATVIPAAGALADVFAFDIGPGNMVIDEMIRVVTKGAQECDVGGSFAARGRPDRVLLDELLTHPYVVAAPPKSTGREVFGKEYATQVFQRAVARGQSHADLLATVTALTSESIALNFEQFVFPRCRVDDIVTSGGGVHNRTLMSMLERRLPTVQWIAHDDVGIPSDAKEAVAVAFLANETLCGFGGNVPGATGASRPVVLGKIIPT